MVSGLLTQVQAIAAGIFDAGEKRDKGCGEHLNRQRHHREEDANGAPGMQSVRAQAATSPGENNDRLTCDGATCPAYALSAADAASKAHRTPPPLTGFIG